MSIFSKNSNSSSTENEEPIAQEIEAQVVETTAEEDFAPAVEQTMRSEFANRPSVLSNKPSIISEGFIFEGTITSDGVLNISGTVRGKITAKSVLIDSSHRANIQIIAVHVAMNLAFNNHLI